MKLTVHKAEHTDTVRRPGTATVRVIAFMVAVLAIVALPGCDTEETEATAKPSTPWDSYSIEPPSVEIAEILASSPYLYPEQECTPAADIPNLPASAIIETDENGQEWVCVWESVVGNAPEGMIYTELADCDLPFTQAPSWFVPPSQRYVSDDSVLDDPAYVEELTWVQGQIESSGCACCHASSVGSGHTSGFDVSAPQVWTDTIETYQLAMISGRFEEHLLFGQLEPDANHGFNRDITMFPSTDPQRMQDFFNAEFDRRNGTEADNEEALKVLQSFFGRLTEPYSECISPWQGIVDDRVVWDGAGDVRQFYVLQDGAETPGFPPNLDQPEGTVWALYVTPDQNPLASGTIKLGEVPDGATQVIPADGSAPEFIEGETYRLFATPDFQLIREINCTITYTEQALD